MEYIDYLQWPAMVVTVASAWFIGSKRAYRRMIAFLGFITSNALWVIWGHHADASQWRSWLLEANLAYPGQADVHLQDFGLALQAARDGYGVALSDEISSSRDLDEGRLVQPFALKVPATMSYYCLGSKDRRTEPELGILIDALVDQAGRTIL
ncbi:LysR substrate-binding domain-containing protein [Pseudomonas yamanorum]|uniref:LysR substrate-binding domain-containing protein n=1 Tax=Pseudomonas yamanorum TaxID=515393 RepID=UPI003D3628C2